MFGQAKAVLSTTNTKTTGADGTINTQLVSTRTEYKLDTGRLNGQIGFGLWTTTFTDDQGNILTTEGKSDQSFEVKTGQARLTESNSVRTSEGPITPYTESHIKNFYKDSGLLERAESDSVNYGADGLATVSGDHICASPRIRNIYSPPKSSVVRKTGLSLNASV